MGLIFYNRLGTAMGIKTDLIAPAASKMSSVNDSDSWFSDESAQNWRSLMAGAGAFIDKPVEIISGAVTTAAAETLAWYFGDPNIATRERKLHNKKFTRPKREYQAENKASAERGFGEWVGELAFGGADQKQWGFILGIEGKFDDGFPEKSPTSAPKPKLGTFSLSGVAFASVCVAGEVESGRHGLEAVLYYYKWRRMSNQNNETPNWISYTIGQTNFPKCWIVGLEFGAQDLNYNIWRWTLTLAVDPEYNPKPLSAFR